MTPNLFRLGLIVTYRCNAECRHCFFESSPRREEVISLELGIKAIDEAAGLGAEWVSLTGGEPFLEPELVSSFIKYASESGLKTEIVSNGYWGTCFQEATRILEPLKDVGLNALNLSIDDLHQEHIPVTSLKKRLLGCTESRNQTNTNGYNYKEQQDHSQDHPRASRGRKNTDNWW